MKKFNFRLQPLLSVREHVEKQRQKEHADALSQVYSQKAKIAATQAEREALLSSERDRLSGRLSMTHLQMMNRYTAKLKRDTIMNTELLKGLEKEAERRREKLVVATRDKKVYEKLKERQKLSYQTDQDRQQAKELDEIGTRAHSWRKSHSR